MFEDADEEFRTEELRELLIHVAQNPAPLRRLEKILRDMKIHMHEQYARLAADELRLSSNIDTQTIALLKLNRLMMENDGLGEMAKDIEKHHGLSVRDS